MCCVLRQWGKHTNFELGTRVPLIFHAAGQTTGLKSNTLVESLDICKPGNHLRSSVTISA